jgi:hypothetical protein
VAERHVLIVQTRCTGGSEAEFNDWYDNEHLNDLLEVPGIVAAQRFELSDVQLKTGERFPYLAIYEIEGDPREWKEAMTQMKGSWSISRCLADSATALYSERGPKKVAASRTSVRTGQARQLDATLDSTETAASVPSA